MRKLPSSSLDNRLLPARSQALSGFLYYLSQLSVLQTIKCLRRKKKKTVSRKINTIVFLNRRGCPVEDEGTVKEAQ